MTNNIKAALAKRALALSAMLSSENELAESLNSILQASAAGIGDNKAPAFADVYAAGEHCTDFNDAIKISITLGKTADIADELAGQGQLRYWLGTAVALKRINFDVKDSAKCETIIKARWPDITEGVLKNRVSVLRAFCNGERHNVLRGIVAQVSAKYAGGESMENTVYNMLVRAKKEGKAKGKKDGEMLPLDAETIEDVMSGKSREAKREATKEKAKAALEQVSVNQLAMEAASRVYTKVKEEDDIAEAVKAFEKTLKAAWNAAHPAATAKALRAAKK